MRPERPAGRAHGPGVDLRRLHYFFAVCDHGGFSKAAGAIGIAQPALTRHIKLLEREIGVALIERSSRGAAPSPPGRFLLDRSRRHLDDLNDIVHETRARFLASPQTLGLGLCPTVAPLFPDGLVPHLERLHPKGAITVIQACGTDLHNLLQAGRLDLIVTDRPSAETGCTMVDLFTERLVLVRAPMQDLVGPVALSDLARHPLVLPSRRHELRRLIDRVAASRSIALEPALELDSLEAVRAVLTKKASRYATVLPVHAVQADVAAQRLRRYDIDEPALQRSVVIVVLPESLKTTAVRDAIAEIRARAGAIEAERSA